MRLKKVWWHGEGKAGAAALWWALKTSRLWFPMLSSPLCAQANLGTARGLFHQIAQVHECGVYTHCTAFMAWDRKRTLPPDRMGPRVWGFALVLIETQSLPHICFRFVRKYWGHTLSEFTLEKEITSLTLLSSHLKQFICLRRIEL